MRCDVNTEQSHCGGSDAQARREEVDQESK